jgi:exosortase/archaeosortase family protein
MALLKSLPQLSREQKLFLRNAIIAILGWIFIADHYEVHNFFTRILASASGRVSAFISGEPSKIYGEHYGATNYVCYNVKDSVGRIFIGWPCNGWDIFYLYVAFILVFPDIPWKRKALYSSIGVVILFGTNVLRVSLLLQIITWDPKSFEFFHKTVFQVVVYLIMFTLWLVYLKRRA